MSMFVLLWQGLLLAQVRNTLKVQDGTALRLSLTEDLSSATNEVDNPVHFEVTEDVKVGDVVAIARGATAVGHVVEAEPRRRMGRAGKLNFTVDHVKAPDGTNLRLRASSTRKGEDKTGTVIVGTVLLSPLFLIMRGKDVTIPRGTVITAYIDGDREIGMAAPSVEAGGQQTAVSSSGEITFKSDPDGADITVDGKFVGSTPTTIRIAPGDHDISVEKAHFAPWKRVMSVAAGGSVNVNATLEKLE
jgi:hypothetical protein